LEEPKTINIFAVTIIGNVNIKKMEQQAIINYSEAIKAIKIAILQSRYRAAALANREMLSLYFGIGKYISENSREATWGTNAIETISAQLQQELPGLRGFGVANIKYMRLFYEGWCDFFNRHSASDETPNRYLSIENHGIINRHLSVDDLSIDTNLLLNINSAVTTAEFNQQYFLQVGFTHHREILNKTTNIDERLFYIQKSATEFWSVEKLRYNLKADLYGKQGTMLNNFSQAITNIDFRKAALNAFKDEYLLDFVNIEDPDDEPDERVLETAIVNNIKTFIMALGKDFSFIGNQYRMIIEEREYFVDLLFFNRQLQCLVAIDLKRGEFKPEYLGKMNFYLSALDDLVRLPHEKLSIGIILCKSQKQSIVEYAFRDMSKPMGVATYQLSSELPEQYRDILPDAETLKKLL
jgi:predicted nuclease of restriction endonuclease-like (RecB) superfamily